MGNNMGNNILNRFFLLSSYKKPHITFCQKSTGNWLIKHKLFIIHPNLFYHLQSGPLPK